jgi:hypothetical protein
MVNLWPLGFTSADRALMYRIAARQIDERIDQAD